METRPHIKIKLDGFDKILERSGWALLIALWALVIFTYGKLPSNIPTHFNASGHIDDEGSKVTFLVLPILGSIIFIGLTILNRYPWIYNYINYAKENALLQYTYATKMIRSLKTAIIFIFLLINIFTWLNASGRMNGLGWWFLPFSLALFLIPTVYYIVKSLKLMSNSNSRAR